MAKLTDEELKYGVVLDEEILFPEDQRPFRVAVIDHDDDYWLDFRHMWKNSKTGKLSHGKGSRIRFSDAETIISAMEQLFLRQQVEWVEE